MVGAFGKATVSGGSIETGTTVLGGKTIQMGMALSGNVTMLGGSKAELLVGGGIGTNVSLGGGTANDTFWGGQGNTTMSGGTKTNTYEFFASAAGGHHVITNFTGKSFLYLEGESLASLQSNHEIAVSGGNTVITLDDQTTITLQGFTSDLKASNIKTSA